MNDIARNVNAAIRERVARGRTLAEEVSEDLRDSIAQRKAELLQQERDEALADLRYSEDTYGSAYPNPTRYTLKCECVYCVRTGKWARECERHGEAS